MFSQFRWIFVVNLPNDTREVFPAIKYNKKGTHFGRIWGELLSPLKTTNLFFLLQMYTVN